jgi:hypothetical protein
VTAAASERLSGADALAAQDEWSVAPAEPTPEPYDEQTAAAAGARFVEALDQLRDLPAVLQRDSLGAQAYAAGQDDPLAAVAFLAGTCAALQDVRRSLGELEALLARAAGTQVRQHALENEGTLPDGRRYKVTKGAERKAWSHDEWQAAARRQVLSGVPREVIDPATGEAVDVAALLVGIEAVHGSGPPRVGQLKKLGLRPDEFCEQVPGPWGVRVFGAHEQAPDE